MDPVSPSHHPKIVLTILSLTLSACGTATFAGGGGRKSGEKKPTAPVATSATPVAPGVPPGPATIPVGDVAKRDKHCGLVVPLGLHHAKLRDDGLVAAAHNLDLRVFRASHGVTEFLADQVACRPPEEQFR